MSMRLESELTFTLTLDEQGMTQLRSICNKCFDGPYGRGIQEQVTENALELCKLLEDEMHKRGYTI